MKNKKAQGLNILLSVVTSIFIIGLLVSIFALMGGSLMNSDSLYQTTDPVTVINETLSSVDDTGENFTVVDYRGVVCTISQVTNATNGAIISTGNYTQTNCNLANATIDFGGLDWNVTYSYVYEAPMEAVSVANDTTTSISSVTDWFNIFIVITAMVVLILLITIIIVAIRGSGMMGGKGSA